MGVGLVISLVLKAKEKKVPLNLKSLPARVKEVFEAANLKKAFPDLYQTGSF
jgi:anti-anti-sigma regulatory factor